MQQNLIVNDENEGDCFSFDQSNSGKKKCANNRFNSM